MNMHACLEYSTVPGSTLAQHVCRWTSEWFLASLFQRYCNCWFLP